MERTKSENMNTFSPTVTHSNGFGDGRQLNDSALKSQSHFMLSPVQSVSNFQ